MADGIEFSAAVALTVGADGRLLAEVPRQVAERLARPWRCVVLDWLRVGHDRGVVRKKEPLRLARFRRAGGSAMMIESAPVAELLAADNAEPWAESMPAPGYLERAGGQGATTTRTPPRGCALPGVHGAGAYILAAKVSFLDLDDGKTVFEDLYRSLTVADADADRGFASLASALGFTSEEVLSLQARPSAIAEDLVAIVREHGHRSAHQGVGTALVLDRQLPRLFGAIADALATHYGIPEKSLAHLRYRAAEADAAEARVVALTASYLSGPFEVFEARRAGREVLWDLTALIDSTLMNTGLPSTGLTDSVAGR